MKQENIQYIEEDTIDLRGLWKVLIKRKLLIVVITVFITFGAVVYTQIAQPVYSGRVMLEIGIVVNEHLDDGKYPSQTIPLDNVNNLKTIVSNTLGVNASVTKKTSLLLVSVTGFDKNSIQKKLEKTVQFVLERHQKMAELYSAKTTKIKMTSLVGEITVSDKAVKPKKKLIVSVAFISGLMLSIFLAFFLEFIQAERKEEN